MLDLEKQAHQQSAAGTKPQRFLQIAKHYRWAQIARRGWNVLRSRIAKHAKIGQLSTPDELQLRNLDRAKLIAEIVIAEQSSRTAVTKTDLEQGKLTRLNQQANVGWPIDWTAADSLPHLWRFQLHYHEFLLPIAADPNLTEPPESNASLDQIGSYEKAGEPIWQVINTWMDNHRPEQATRIHESWHPYCISRRMPVWIWLLSSLRANEFVALKMAQNLFQQAKHLHANLERDLGGNHLIENLSALAIAAAVLDSETSERWLKTVSQFMEVELERQVLAHGEHFELSPMYHCQILSNLLRIHWMCQGVAPKLANTCLEHAKMMFDFLLATIHPDNEIALMGDSGFGEAPTVAEIRRLAENSIDLPTTRSTSADVVKNIGPYWVYRNSVKSSTDQAEHDFLLYDRGATAAAELPAHGHCDLLGFEASIAGRRWFVDSGNFNYEADSMRSYCRSSLAHNVVTLDSQNQSNIWSKFRMGNRAKIISRKSGERSGFFWATGHCNAYHHLGVDRIGRLIAISPARDVWACADFVQTKNLTEIDEEFIAYLHLAPELVAGSCAKFGDRDGFELSDGETTRNISFFNVAKVELMDGWYCPEFGIRRKNTVLVYRCSDRSQPFGWLLCKPNGPELTTHTSSAKFLVSDESKSFVFDWKYRCV